MCGRFTLTTDDFETVANTFGAYVDPDAAAEYRPRYNAAPGDTCWIVTLESIEHGTKDPRRRLATATWGFPLAGPDARSVINARAESLHEKASFAEAFWTGRCGVVVDGFFEWTGPKGDRQPLWLHRPDHAPFLLGGIVHAGRFAILTTEPNELVAPHHDRMPVVLPPGRVDEWLHAPGHRSRDAIEHAATLFAPPPADWLAMTAVDRRVSDIHNDDPSCLQPVDYDTSGGSKQTDLF
jgi:putative SOS response-associated peptidase YedK